MTLDDAFATGSSLMPQKKNPDVGELARGRAGRAIGDLVALLATDAAEYLVERGVPFREAHEAVGKAAAFSTAQGRPLAKLTPAEWKTFHPRFERDVLRCFDARRSLSRRDLPGAPGPRQVARQLSRGEKALRERAR